jgi:transcriptional antiterminator RfaH
MSFWTAVQTISGQEDLVASRVTRSGIRTLAPRARFEIDGEMRIAAVFPGYFFAEIESQWYDVKWCAGVLRIIMSGEHPARLPDAEIEKIMRDIGDNGLLKLPKTPAPVALTQGDSVKILTGNFRGLSAIYQGMSARQREIVLLDLLGRKVPVELHADDRIVAL